MRRRRRELDPIVDPELVLLARLKAWLRGEEAGARGTGRRSNPYPAWPVADECCAWLCGWRRGVHRRLRGRCK